LEISVLAVKSIHVLDSTPLPIGVFVQEDVILQSVEVIAIADGIVLVPLVAEESVSSFAKVRDMPAKSKGYLVKR
jgi:hypothetical protein